MMIFCVVTLNGRKILFYLGGTTRETAVNVTFLTQTL